MTRYKSLDKERATLAATKLPKETTLTKPFDISKRITTREGLPVRILETAAKSPWPIIGLVQHAAGDETLHSWTTDGYVFEAEDETHNDLINVDPIKRTMFKNFDLEDFWGGEFNGLLQATQNLADDTGVKPLGVIRIDLEDGVPVEVKLVYTYRTVYKEDNE